MGKTGYLPAPEYFQSTRKGIEADLNYNASFGLAVNVNYSYNESKVKEFDERPELNDKILTYAPKHQVKGSVMWTGGVVDATIRGRYKTKQYTTEDNESSIAGFSTWDVQLSKWFFERRLYVGGEIINVFDNRHMNTKEYMSAGRLMNVKLAIHLSK